MGFKSEYDFRDRNINLQSRFGKDRDWQFDLNIGKNKALLNLKKEFWEKMNYFKPHDGLIY